MKNENFKIIAIRPLKGCRQDYLKILKEDELYYFYNNYKIDSKDTITFEEALPDTFYKTNNININISAIVGKNGSGKSTIIELLFRAINNIAFGQKEITADLEKIPDLRVDLYIQLETFIKIRINKSQIEVYRYDSNGVKISIKEDSIRLKDIFYTIAVNYSHYAYNTTDIENEVNWLDGLFHKNDGYQTPLVINPKRTNGNIDINNENHLVKSRLIGNLLRPVIKENFNFRKLTEKLEATSLKLSLNKSKRDSILYENIHDKGKLTEEVKLASLQLNENDVLNKLNKAYNFNYQSINKEENKLALDYLIYKIVSIATKYDDYSEYFLKEEKRFHESKFDKFILQLVEDESHITFKLRQTLHFLRYQHIKLKDQIISLSSLSNEIAKLKTGRKRIEIIEFLPPPIFSVDIILKTQDGLTNDIEFKKLSSGEKQMIYSVSSLLYHLVNLNSITNTKKRTGYKYVNIVLEEIELYFHPEMQRTYINYILDSLSRLELHRIKAINFCFVTHSPFILSDIPDSNILFLDENGLPEKNRDKIRTFGGNIHELLALSFFLGSGFIGAFAKKKIQTIIDFLKNNEKHSNIIKNRETVLQEIQIIGEPFLKEKLMEMYYNKYQKQKRITELKEEIYRLENND